MMATRMDPMDFSFVLVRKTVGYDGWLGGRVVGRRVDGRGWGRTLGLDQLGEPAHLTFGRLQAVPLQLGGVEVEPLAALGRGGAEGVQALLQPAAAALEDAQAHVGVCLL